MPVIRGTPTAAVLTAERRNALVEQLTNELSGNRVPNGPVIFEIPLKESSRIDVLVVWDEFDGLISEDCTSTILEAYKDQERNIAQALGVTYHEAMEQQLLPYAVIPMTRRGEVDLAALRQAMLEEGAINVSQDKVDLRFPTMPTASAGWNVPLRDGMMRE